MDKLLTFTYRNHRGEIGKRSVVPMTVWFGKSAYHDGEQWFLKAHDPEKGIRDFAMADISEIERG